MRTACTRTLLAAGLIAATQAFDGHPGRAETPAVPVIVELFSSEGCSSCPPADALLASLPDRAPPGVDLIGLEWHVDYWNDLGWADPFSSSAATARQRGYARRLGRGNVYTPQMVVDGRAQFVGSDTESARSETRAAAQRAHVPIEISWQSPDAVRIRVRNVPAGASLVVAVTESHLRTEVLRGENAGRTLAHGPVVRWSVEESVGQGGVIDRIRPVSLKPEWRRENVSVVAFLQADDGGVLGAGQVRLPKEAAR